MQLSNRGVLLPLGVWDSSWDVREGHSGMLQGSRCLVKEARAGKERDRRSLTGNTHGETGRYEDNMNKQALITVILWLRLANDESSLSNLLKKLHFQLF